MADEHLIPDAVAREIRAGRDTDPAKRWLRGAPPVTVVPVSVRPDVAEWGLGAGESAAISLARETPGAEVILDERAGRLCARALGLRPRGTLGVLLDAKRCGLVPDVRSQIDALLRAGYHLGGDLIAIVLEEAGEG